MRPTWAKEKSLGGPRRRAWAGQAPWSTHCRGWGQQDPQHPRSMQPLLGGHFLVGGSPWDSFLSLTVFSQPYPVLPAQLPAPAGPLSISCHIFPVLQT